MAEEDAQQPRRRSSAISSQLDEDSEDQNNANEHPSVRHHLSIRLFWITVGIISLALGCLGIVLPGKYQSFLFCGVRYIY